MESSVQESITVTGKDQLVQGRFLNLYNLKYTSNSQEHSTLHFERPSKQGQERLSTGSEILALGVDPKDNRIKIILEIIYRMPIERYVVQYPAGLRDPHETDLVQCALRELKEETGYVGQPPSSEAIVKLKPIWESPILFNDPWKSNETTNIVTVEVDFSLEENQNPKAHLEDDEDIEVIVLDFLTLNEELARIKSERGFDADNRITQLALGLQIAKQLVGK